MVAAIGDVREVVDHTVRLSIAAEEAAHLPNLEGQASEPLEVSDQDASGLGPPSGTNIWANNVPVALPPLVTTATNAQPYVLEDWRNVPEQSLVLREGLPVYTEDGALVGSVDELVMEPATHAVTHLIVRQAGGAGHDKAIPVGWIERSDEDTGVFLAVQRAEVEGLPDYH